MKSALFLKMAAVGHIPKQLCLSGSPSTPSPEAAHCLEPFLLSGPGCLAQLSSMVLWLGWAGLSASSRVESQETREKMTGMKKGGAGVGERMDLLFSK